MLFTTKNEPVYLEGLIIQLCFRLALCFPFSTTTLAIGGWLNSDLLFINSLGSLLLILIASFACLDRASLKIPVISILKFTFSFLWAESLCLESALSVFLFLNPSKCSFHLTQAEREDS